MTTARWEKVKQLFVAAVDLAEQARAQFLDEACAKDASLRHEVERLLAGDQETTAEVLDQGVAIEVLAAATRPPESIGPYSILEMLGEGGMGQVFLAQQHEPVERRVALKLIKRGMDSDAVLARFAAERRALALMEHDNIAKVFDAGTAESGQPFFVMEYVPGMPLTDYCEHHRHDMRARLELFVKVCEGVQHAHQKGVIHRDLKPSNILVSEQSRRAVPKIIDFGVAKAIEEDHTTTALRTQHGQAVGTPLYMSPEQATPSTAGVDTRSDVYSLGVVLHELLTRELPRRPDEKPSSLSIPNASELRGDLDWIVMKAIDPDRDRRYATPIGLADDVVRHLRDEPVLASPPSAAYRIRKFARRHRLQVIAAGVVLVTLLGGITSTTVFMLKAELTLGNFNLLSNVVRLREAQRIYDDRTALYPAWPNSVGRLESWLVEHGEPLERELPTLERTLETIRAQALAPTDDEIADRRREHPRTTELEALRAEFASRHYAHAVRSGQAEPRRFVIDFAIPADLPGLERLAWPLVSDTRRIWGRESEGLALARRAQEAATPAQRAKAADLLAWALFGNGLDALALEMADTAVRLAGEDDRDRLTKGRETLQRRVEAARTGGATLEADIDQLQREIDDARGPTFGAEADQFLYDTLAELIRELRAFVNPEHGPLAHVRARKRWAETVRARSIEAHAAAWAKARDAVDIAPQIGLAPIGRNPATRLWEFYHLRSAADPDAIPLHTADGAIEVGPGTGIVFVLVPGGEFLMGAQADDPSRPNYDAGAKPHESPYGVVVEPFFIARHELTQGQWSRLSPGEMPSGHGLGWDRPDDRAAPVTAAHPVEQVTWLQCAILLERHALALPTESQWEYACRAGHASPWSCGKDPMSLEGHANILDKTAGVAVSQWGTPEDLDDGFIAHAPVGSFAPNAFGLHDMHGNVWEWCHGDRGATHPTIVRGGAFSGNAADARSALRLSAKTGTLSSSFGVRAIRRVER